MTTFGISPNMDRVFPTPRPAVIGTTPFKTGHLMDKKNFGKDGYPRWKPGMKLPAGMAPPLPGFTHEDIIVPVLDKAGQYLQSLKIGNPLLNETIFSIGANIIHAFEKEFVEYKLAACMALNNSQSKGASRTAQTLALLAQIDEMADKFSLLAGKAAIAALEGSPIQELGEQGLKFLNTIKFGIEEKILDLKKSVEKPSALALGILKIQGVFSK
jgi:hypothetical protein